MSTDNFTLADCEESEHGTTTRWTHPSGAWVELQHDDSPHHPLDDAEGIAISFREGERYVGTMDDHPSDPVIECSACHGTGEHVDRMTITRYPIAETTNRKRRIVAAGSSIAMEALYSSMCDDPDEDEFYLSLDPEVCANCNGDGEVETTLEDWFRRQHDAVAIYEFSTGNYSEVSAVMVITDNDWTDPIAAAKAWADEYQSWAEGDVWGIVAGGPGIPYGEEHSVWGFIGRDHAEAEALGELNDMVYRVERERAENAYWRSRDVETV